MQILPEARRQEVFLCNWHRSLVFQVMVMGSWGGCVFTGGIIYIYICMYVNNIYIYDISHIHVCICFFN